MSAQRKCGLQSSSEIDLDASCGDPPTKKRSVQKKTVEKWIVENDKELNTSVWFKFEMAAATYIICVPTRDRNDEFILKFILHDKKMADFERRQLLEIGLEFVR